LYNAEVATKNLPAGVAADMINRAKNPNLYDLKNGFNKTFFNSVTKT